MTRVSPSRPKLASGAAPFALLGLLVVGPKPQAHAQGLLSEIGVPGARERLSDSNPRARRLALESLIRLADRALCPWIGRRAADEEPSSVLTPDLLRALGRLRCRAFGPALWRIARSSSTPARVRAAIDALGRLGDPQSIPHLVRLARTGQAVLPAVEAIARFGEAGSRALRRLATSSPIASAAALRVLVGWRLSGRKQALREALRRKILSPKEALRILSETEAPSFHEAVVPYLFHPDRAVQARALSALARIGTREQARAVMTLLADPTLRQAALETLVQIAARRPPDMARRGTPPPHSRPITMTPLLSLIRTGRGETPLLAITALGRLGGQEIVPPLAWLAEHGAPRLREQAVRTLQYVRTPLAARVLRRLLRRGGPLAPLAALSLGSLLRAPAGTLDRWHPLPPPMRAARRAAISDLLALLHGRDLALRVAAIRGLGRIRALAAEETLIHLLQARRPPPATAPRLLALSPPRRHRSGGPVCLRRAAAEALSRFRDDETAQALTRALQRDPDLRVRAAAALAMASVGSTWPLKALERALREAPEPVVLNASYSLGRLGYRSAAPALTALLRSQNPNLRSNAALALGRLRHASARARLERLARADPSSSVRRAAAIALAWALGRKARPALRRLLRRETNPQIAQSIARTLPASRGGRPPLRPPPSTGWIDFQLEGSKGRPLAGRAYQIRLLTGDCLTGATDVLGLGGAELIPEGEVDVNLLPAPSASGRSRMPLARAGAKPR